MSISDSVFDMVIHSFIEDMSMHSNIYLDCRHTNILRYPINHPFIPPFAFPKSEESQTQQTTLPNPFSSLLFPSPVCK